MPQTIDRREFLGTVGATAGALVAAVIAPLGVAHGAAPLESERPSPSSVASALTEEGWDVDDICGHRPRYAHPIPHAPARSSPVLWECIDPVDHNLVI
jgi:hypothetical protein